ncbi:MAG: hypothetical protein GWN85_20965, partial [Gemmatimonadetes bacterium]|nr:hypothetical protein [Gemmatimonadota bacterium]NIR38108.1 hypothetical protein [Actinomycetota bacterium]NIS32678.1 hypothetical protein [Actinomycetota bacterium]NIU67680.1 hypothetical protein [Actinomycetota bacterium]NIW29447.1 hypothetical protein [Actinomycetota bacterium]
VPYLLRSLEQALRAGYSLRQGVVRVAADVDGLDGLAADLDAGAALDEAFARWAAGRPEPDARLLTGAVRLQLDAGGNLADTFGILHRVLERR